MQRKIKYTKEFYKLAVKLMRHGWYDPDKGRHIGKLADGFSASDGYDLRKFSEWTPYQKRKLRKYFHEVDELSARPYKLFRSPNKKNLEAVQKASKHKAKLKGLKVAFIPVGDPDQKVTVHINRKTKEVTVTESGVTRKSIFFDPVKLVIEPKKEIQRVIDANPARGYQIHAGKSLIPGMYNKDDIVPAILKKQEKYNADDYDPDDPNSSYHGNWLDGVDAFNYPNRVVGSNFRKGRQKAKAKFKDERRSHRRAIEKIIEGKKRRGERII